MTEQRAPYDGPRPRAAYQQTCRSCGAPIRWLRTRSLKNMPVDDPTGQILPTAFFDPKVHVSHFATCPNAERHRKPREKADG